MPDATSASSELPAPQRIESVLVIDDAFDPLGADHLAARAVDRFMDAVEASERPEELTDALRARGCLDGAGKPDASKIFERLKDEIQGEPPELRQLAEDHLLANWRGKRRHIDALVLALEEEGLAVETSGSEFKLPKVAPQVVLLDYFLGFEDDLDARDRAVKRLRDIATKYGTQLPFVVLMSSKNLAEEERGQLRDEAGWLAGLFDFAHKPEIATRELVRQRRLFWEMALPIRHQVASFLQALKTSVTSIGESFTKKVSSIGLEDFAYIQHFHLNKEGQPLGEYMQWLLGSLLPHLAFDAQAEVAQARRVLDAVRFDNLLPANLEPSLALAECYGYAISTSAVEKVDAHPLHRPALEEPGLPYLQTGDMFGSGGNEIWVIVNAPCDVALAPLGNRGDARLSLVLVPGDLRRIDSSSEAATTDSVITRLFQHNQSPHRIHWRVKQAIAVGHGKFREWLESTQLKRVARLHLPYVMELQHAFATELTRVGMPVSPPYPFSYHARVFRRTLKGKRSAESVDVPRGGRVFNVHHEAAIKDSFQLGAATMGAVALELAKVSSELESAIAAEQAGKWRDSLAKRLADIDAVFKNPAKWLALSHEAHALPKSKEGKSREIPVVPNVLTVTLDAPAEQVSGSVVVWLSREPPEDPAVSAPRASIVDGEPAS